VTAPAAGRPATTSDGRHYRTASGRTALWQIEHTRLALEITDVVDDLQSRSPGQPTRAPVSRCAEAGARSLPTVPVSLTIPMPAHWRAGEITEYRRAIRRGQRRQRESPVIFNDYMNLPSWAIRRPRSCSADRMRHHCGSEYS